MSEPTNDTANTRSISGTFDYDEWMLMMAALDIFTTSPRISPDKQAQLRQVRDHILAILKAVPSP